MQWCAGFSGPFWQAYHEVIPKDPGTVNSAFQNSLPDLLVWSGVLQRHPDACVLMELCPGPRLSLTYSKLM